MTKTQSAANTWGGWLRRFRLELGLSQDRLADQIVLLCAHMSDADEERFKQLRLECPEALAGYEVSRFESGMRTPLRRSFHMLLIWALVEMGLSLDVKLANQWLELGQQGWLTDREQSSLFG